ncbi:MAG: hypothetical protein AAF551_12825, partial [Bacteroidota bacterium]
MKNPFILLSTALLLLLSCTDELPEEIQDPEEEPSLTGNIQFNVILPETNQPDENTNKTIVKVVASIKKASEEASVQAHTLGVSIIDDQLVSEALALDYGTYTLVGFLVLDENDEVRYRTPTEAAEAADQVKVPLPYPLVIESEEVMPIELQVVSLADELPDVEDPETDLLEVEIAAYLIEGDAFDLIPNAWVQVNMINKETKETKEAVYELLDGKKTISLDASYDEYEFVVSIEEGYAFDHLNTSKKALTLNPKLEFDLENDGLFMLLDVPEPERTSPKNTRLILARPQQSIRTRFFSLAGKSEWVAHISNVYVNWGEMDLNVMIHEKTKQVDLKHPTASFSISEQVSKVREINDHVDLSTLSKGTRMIRRFDQNSSWVARYKISAPDEYPEVSLIVPLDFCDTYTRVEFLSGKYDVDRKLKVGEQTTRIHEDSHQYGKPYLNVIAFSESLEDYKDACPTVDINQLHSPPRTRRP